MPPPPPLPPGFWGPEATSIGSSSGEPSTSEESGGGGGGGAEYLPLRFDGYSGGSSAELGGPEQMTPFEPVNANAPTASVSSQEVLDQNGNPLVIDGHPVIYRRVSKKKGGHNNPTTTILRIPSNKATTTTSTTTKRKKKKKKNRPKTTIATVDQPVTAQPNYSVNKIIVIEESDTVKEVPVVKNEENNTFVNIRDFQSDRKAEVDKLSSEQMAKLLGTLPVATMREIHSRLNTTLLRNEHNKPSSPATTTSTTTTTTTASSTSPSEAFRPMTTTSKVTTGGHFASAGEMKNTSDMFNQGNRFSFEKYWQQHRNEPKTTSTTDGTARPTTTMSSMVLDEHGHLMTSSHNRPWATSHQQHLLPSPSPPTYYFTSQRPYYYQPPIQVRPTMSRPGGEEIVTAASPPNIFSGMPSSSIEHVRDMSKLSSVASPALSMAKVGTIIFGFCLSMLVLAALILVVMHKETVGERLRNWGEAIESRYTSTTFWRPGDDGVGPVPGARPQAARPAATRSAAHPTEVITKAKQLPPLPGEGSKSGAEQYESPERLRMCPTTTKGSGCGGSLDETGENNKDLIEQIIGRPESGSFTHKKCRQYFSRVRLYFE